jgi:hypothetical protein
MDDPLNLGGSILWVPARARVREYSEERCSNLANTE